MRRALPHLWQRLRRRYALFMLHGRQRQLLDYVALMERQVAEDIEDIDLAKAELALIAERLSGTSAADGMAVPRQGAGQP